MNKIEKELNLLMAKPNETIREHTDKVKKSCEKLKELGYISDEIYSLLNLACEFHDYGKVNDEFQNRIKTGRRFNNEKEVGHNILSTFFLNKDDFKNENDYEIVFYAVINHHHYVDNFQVLREKLELCLKNLENYEVQTVKRRALGRIEDRESFKIDAFVGLLNKCDYAGSGNYEIEYPNDFLVNSLENLNYTWNDLQKYLIENRDENLIVVANTGMGKTEGGLLWIGDNKGFFILPLKSAINSIFSRVSKGIIKGDSEKKVVLLHSEAFDYYISNLNEEKNYNDIKTYFQEGKSLSLPLTISTLDQIFNFVFNYHGSEVKLGTLSYSKVVLDEIQAYSPDLLAYIVIGLKRIKEVGGKFAILTATLPPFIKDYLEEELGEIKYKAFIQGKTRHNLEIVNSELNSSFIYKKYTSLKNKTLIVCNTIKKAQNIYEELLELGIPCNEIELLHSKFIKRDRLEKEKNILKFGDSYFQGEKIWISTSLVEASLDIDFDILYTELNDLSGLFQRLGRVNRKGIKKVNQKNAYVFTEINKKLFINGDMGFIDRDIFNLSLEALKEVNGELEESKKFYLMEKYLTLDKIEKSSFNRAFEKNKDYMKLIWKGKFSKEEVNKIFRNIISYKVIPKIVYEENKEVIDELLNKYNVSTGKEKDLAKIEINSYTLSIGIFEKGKNYDKIYLDYDEILIVNGEYSYEKGFSKEKKEDYKNEEVTIFI